MDRPAVAELMADVSAVLTCSTESGCAASGAAPRPVGVTSRTQLVRALGDPAGAGA